MMRKPVKTRKLIFLTNAWFSHTRSHILCVMHALASQFKLADVSRDFKNVLELRTEECYCRKGINII